MTAVRAAAAVCTRRHSVGCAHFQVRCGRRPAACALQRARRWPPTRRGFATAPLLPPVWRGNNAHPALPPRSRRPCQYIAARVGDGACLDAFQYAAARRRLRVAAADPGGIEGDRLPETYGHAKVLDPRTREGSRLDRGELIQPCPLYKERGGTTLTLRDRGWIAASDSKAASPDAERGGGPNGLSTAMDPGSQWTRGWQTWSCNGSGARKRWL